MQQQAMCANIDLRKTSKNSLTLESNAEVRAKVDIQTINNRIKLITNVFISLFIR